jgi:hypothetical protein
MVLINRDEKITQEIIKNWNSDLCDLCVTNSRGDYPGRIIPLNEYLSYNKFLYILFNSKAIIDISNIKEYNSAILHLSLAKGIQVISNNNYINNKENCINVQSAEEINEKLISESLSNVNLNNDMSKYNYNLLEMMKLFS